MNITLHSIEQPMAPTRKQKSKPGLMSQLLVLGIGSHSGEQISAFSSTNKDQRRKISSHKIRAPGDPFWPQLPNASL